MHTLSFLDKVFLSFVIELFNDLNKLEQDKIIEKINSDEADQGRSGANTLTNLVAGNWKYFPSKYHRYINDMGETNGVDFALSAEFPFEYVKTLFCVSRFHVMYIFWFAFRRPLKYDHDESHYCIDYKELEHSLRSGAEDGPAENFLNI